MLFSWRLAFRRHCQVMRLAGRNVLVLDPLSAAFVMGFETWKMAYCGGAWWATRQHGNIAGARDAVAD
jgi:hypothetical protein